MITLPTDLPCDADALADLKPLRASMFALDAEGLPFALRGNYCADCKRLFFPVRQRCMQCAAFGHLEDVVLPTHGVVHASTVSHVRSAVGHEPPYAYGYVSLDGDRLRIFAPFEGDDPNWFQPGRHVQLHIGRIRAANLPAALGYSFIPRHGALDAGR
jgi:uncharacterized OB-fold protein